MIDDEKVLPVWILIVSGLFALMELGVGVSMVLSPQSTLEMVDLSARGVGYVVSMWAVRQFALGVIFAYAAFKRSKPMLTIAYLFFFVMFAGDLIVGIAQNETPLIMSAVVMCLISAAMIYMINKRGDNSAAEVSGT